MQGPLCHAGISGHASAPQALIETDESPLDGYAFRVPCDDRSEIVFGIRPEHVSLAMGRAGRSSKRKPCSLNR